MVYLEELDDGTKLALMAYALYGKGPINFEALRRIYIVSPCFSHIEGDWFDKSLDYAILTAEVFDDRGGKLYISKKYMERLKNVNVDISACLPKKG